MTTINGEIISRVTEYYRHLHEYPEISFQEYKTSDYIRGILNQYGIEYHSVGKTGVLGYIESNPAFPTIALRADMDGLPIQENPAHLPCSLRKGIMHACGHDIHTACLLGAAEYLQNHRHQLPVNVLLIFQHAEELLPGGALDVLQNDFFKTHYPEWIIAQHAEPELAVGQVGICPGRYMASGDEIYITLHGPGGHGALPEQTVDLILIASHIIVALQQITSRQASPQTPTVLTFGNIRCQSAMNIIPQEITLEGTFRTFDEQWRSRAKAHIRTISLAIAESMGAEGEVNIVEGYPVLYNDPVKAEMTMQILKNTLGDHNLILLPKRMTTEDFARYSQIIPATFLRLGVKGEQNSGKLHTPEFQADPAALKYGIQTLCSLVESSTSFFANH